MERLRREEYTDEQWAVITARSDADLAVASGPGSGKTKTTAGRVARLLTDEAIPPEGVVATTYTDIGGAVLFERVYHLLGGPQEPGAAALATPPDLSALTIATMHSYLRGLLQRRVPRFGKVRVFVGAERDLLLCHPRFARAIDLTRVQRLDLDDQLLAALPPKLAAKARQQRGRAKDRTPFLTDHPEDRALFLRAADAAREECLPPASLPDGFREALASYRGLLAEQNIWDYTELLCAAHDALTDERDPDSLALQEYLRATLRCVLVDEFQDLNVILYRIVRRLHQLGARITAVGDGDQVCYRWRGSDPRVFSSFARTFPGAKDHQLTTNFRSSPEIVGASRAFIEGQILADRIYKPLSAPAMPNQTWERGDLAALRFGSVAEQDDFGIGWLKALHGAPYRDRPDDPLRGLTWGEMRVLVRTTDAARQKARSLERAGIPYQLTGAEYLLGSAEERAVAALYGYLGGRVTGDDARAAWSETGLGTDDAAVGHALAQLDTVRAAGDDDGRRPVCLIRAMYGALSALRFSRESVLAAAPQRVDLVLTNVARVLRAAQAYQSVLFREAAAWKFPDFARWLVEVAPSTFEDGHVSPVPLSFDAVQISTIHGAKGTEAPVVWVADLYEGHLPHFRARPDVYSRLWEVIPRGAVRRPERYDGTLDDEARLMYVAMTRAAKFLLLTHGRPDPSFDRLGRPRPTPGPSRYLRDMERDPRFVTAPAEAVPLAARGEKLPPWKPDEGRTITLTPTQLTVYRSCPRQFLLRVIYGFPPAMSESLGFPEALHRCHAQIEDRLMADGDIPDDALPAIVDAQFDVPFAGNKGRQRLYQMAREEVASYARWARERAAEGITTEAVEKASTLQVGNIRSVGRLDLTQRGADGRVTVLDWKATQQAAARDPDFFKTRIYALCEEACRGEAVTAVGTCIAGLKGAAPSVAVEPFDEERRADVIARIKEAGAAIPARDLPMVPQQGEQTCGDCDPSAVCSRGQGDLDDRAAG